MKNATLYSAWHTLMRSYISPQHSGLPIRNLFSALVQSPLSQWHRWRSKCLLCSCHIGPHLSKWASPCTSAKCKSVRKPPANLPDIPVALTSASKYFQMLPGPPGALQRALRLCKRFSDAPERTCSYGGAFRMLRDSTIRIVKFWSRRDLWSSSVGDLQPYSHSTDSEDFTTTRHFVYHINLCYYNMIRYIIIWLVFSKSHYINTYGDTGIPEMDSETGSTYLGVPGVDRHHHIIWNTHSIFPSSWFHSLLRNFHGSPQIVWFLTHSCQAFIDPHYLCGSWPGITSHSLTLFVSSLSEIRFSSGGNSLRMRCEVGVV